MSEIDEIFSSKGKQKAVSLSTPAPQLPEPKKKKKDKKRKRDAESQTETAEPLARAVPETVHDPSILIPKKKRTRTELASTSTKDAPTKKPPKEDDERQFRDSRGTGPRKKTEEGWNVYKEDELGIRDEGGDTPLCPFDCDCCF